MRYFDYLGRVQSVLLVAGFFILLSSSFFLSDVLTGRYDVLEGDIPNNTTDDIVFGSFMVFISLFYLVIAWLYPRRNIWVWRSLYLVNIAGGLFIASFVIAYSLGLMTADVFLAFLVFLYLVSCILIHLSNRKVEVKALFRLWEGKRLN